MIVIALENVRSVYNVGSIFRTMEGLGFKNVALIGITPTPLTHYGNKRSDFAKTALGAENTLAWKHYETLGDLIHEYPKAVRVSIEKTNDARDISQMIADVSEMEADVIVIFGNEVDGVSKEALSLSTATYQIPMNGTKESFNVAVSAGICLYLLSTSMRND